MSAKIGAVTVALTAVATAAGVVIASQGWGLVTTGLAGLSVICVLTSLGLLAVLLFRHPRHAPSTAHAARI